MGFKPQVVLARDRHRCRFRFSGCKRRASRVVLGLPRMVRRPSELREREGGVR